MAEVRPIVDKKITYSGLFSLKGLYKIVSKTLDDLGYGPYEAEHIEQVTERGKEVLITFKGDTKLSDFAKIEWEAKIVFTFGEEVIVEKEHQKVKMFKGKVVVSSEVILKTDHDKSFEQNAWLYFLRVVLDKFVFKNYISRASGKAKKDYSQFESKVKSFLNLESFK